MATKRRLMKREDGTLFIQVEDVERGVIITGHQEGGLLFEDPKIYGKDEHYEPRYGLEKDEYLENLTIRYKREALHADTKFKPSGNLFSQELSSKSKSLNRITGHEKAEKLRMEKTKEEYIREKMNPIQRAYADLKSAWKRFGSIVKNASPIKYESINKSVPTIGKIIDYPPIDTKALQAELNNIKKENQALPQKTKASSAYKSFVDAISRFSAIFSLGKRKEADLGTEDLMTFSSIGEDRSSKRPRSLSQADIQHPDKKPTIRRDSFSSLPPDSDSSPVKPAGPGKR